MSGPGSGKPRGPYAKTALRQADILERASEAFSRSGFQGASLREIASAVGLTLPGVMHHFPTKDSLLTAVLQAKDAAFAHRYVDIDEDRSVVERIRQVVQDNAGNAGLVRLFAKLTAEALTDDHPAHQYFASRYEQVRSIFAMGVEQAQARGEMRSDLDPEITGQMLTALMDGIQLQWLMDESEVDMVRVVDALLALLAPPAGPTPGRRTGKTVRAAAPARAGAAPREAAKGNRVVGGEHRTPTSRVPKRNGAN